MRLLTIGLSEFARWRAWDIDFDEAALAHTLLRGFGVVEHSRRDRRTNFLTWPFSCWKLER
jgi:hypothetical protein